MEILEMIRRWKRTLENSFTYRRAFILITIVFGFIFYVGPSIMRILSQMKPDVEDAAEQCLKERLKQFKLDFEEYNANIQHIPILSDEKPYIPYIGNGVFGLSILPDSPIYIKYGRTLSLPVNWHPIVTVNGDLRPAKEATVLHYLTGIAHRFQCFDSGLFVSYKYYAHRSFSGILVQDVTITNPTNQNAFLNLQQLKLSTWPTAVSHPLTFQHTTEETNYLIVTGMIDLPNHNSNVMAVSIMSRKVPRTVEVAAHKSSKIEFLTSIHYTGPMKKSEYAANVVEYEVKEKMKKAVMESSESREASHINVWQNLWSTGVSISQSKAAHAINGDKINATIYYVLSQVRSPYYEEGTTKDRKNDLANSLFYAEGCYGGHHTLQADNLWGDLSTVKDVNTTASYWLLTLEKQGCHNLLKAGASGVIQAIVLSVGSLRFSNQHLEFNIHPKFLHRDFLFRRIGYGNSTHVNISVIVQDDNRAVLYVALDRSDKFYYACDGGCLDTPVQLGPVKIQFPVKLTDPVTSILYITYDRQHMEDLRHAIHVKEIVEAPAHEHHVIALHKHGDHLGGLPALFWVSISFLIIIFHLFLFKLIYNEYCGSQDKYRTRFGKL